MKIEIVIKIIDLSEMKEESKFFLLKAINGLIETIAKFKRGIREAQRTNVLFGAPKRLRPLISKSNFSWSG